MPIALDRARGLGALEPTITPNQRTIMNSKMHIGTQPRIEGDPLAIGLGGWGRSGTILGGLSGRPSAARRPATPPPKPSGAQTPPKTHVHETGAPCTFFVFCFFEKTDAWCTCFVHMRFWRFLSSARFGGASLAGGRPKADRSSPKKWSLIAPIPPNPIANGSPSIRGCVPMCIFEFMIVR